MFTYVSSGVQFPQRAAFVAPCGAYVLQLLRKLADIVGSDTRPLSLLAAASRRKPRNC